VVASELERVLKRTGVAMVLVLRRRDRQQIFRWWHSLTALFFVAVWQPSSRRRGLGTGGGDLKRSWSHTRKRAKPAVVDTIEGGG
jgi:hypothetical protein